MTTTVVGPAEPPIGTPEAGSAAFRRWSEWLGRRLADEGPAAVEPHLAVFAATALGRRAVPDVARVLADRTRPGIVRARAFFVVAMALDDAEAQAKNTCATS